MKPLTTEEIYKKIILNEHPIDKYVRRKITTVEQALEALESYAKERIESVPHIQDREFSNIVPDLLDVKVTEQMFRSGKWKRHNNGFSLKAKYLK